MDRENRENRKRSLLDRSVNYERPEKKVKTTPAAPTSPSSTPAAPGDEPLSTPVGEMTVTSSYSPLCVPLELFRASRVKWLRSKLAMECKKSDGAKVPLLTFERWVARSALLGGEETVVHLMPSATLDTNLVHDLERAGVQNATTIATKMTKHVAKARQLLQEFTPLPEDAEQTVWKADKYHRIDLHFGDKREYQSINKDHYGKLWSLYRFRKEGKFDADVLCLLTRYAALGGHGYQAGLVGEAFEVLHEDLKVACECFASPLNCRYGSYCSAFDDTDARFGSMGSFFDFAPKKGSFEVNPPFVPETMMVCVDHITTLLTASEEAGLPLSFVVIVPAWSEVRMWKALQRSTFLRAHFVVPARAHSFTDGAQHHSVEYHRPSSYDSGVFILQSTKGVDTYPIKETLEDRLIEAMRGSCVREVVRDCVVYVSESEEDSDSE